MTAVSVTVQSHYCTLCGSGAMWLIAQKRVLPNNEKIQHITYVMYTSMRIDFQ